MRLTKISLALVVTAAWIPGCGKPEAITGSLNPTSAASANADAGTCTLANGNVVATGYDQYGYNRCGNHFNSSYSSWCVERGAPADCVGIYSNDRLNMKWNEEWDRGNAENWTDPDGYDAWIENQINGNGPDGSGSVWHYKIQWVGACGADYTPLPDGGYCLWGQFEVLMDQGQDPNFGPGHLWFARANSNGYGN